MIILLTNDDGIYAEGIQILADTLMQMKDIKIYIVAPDRERSATGHAITMHRPLRAEEAKFYHNPFLEGWSVNGTPSDCVKLALEYLLPQKPDLVISGINLGENLGTDILYSGTVSAAIEAIILGVPALAVSLVEQKNPDFRFVAGFLQRFLNKFKAYDLPEHTLLNINVPAKNQQEIAGVAVTRLGVRLYRNAFEKRVDPRGRNYFWLAGEAIDIEDRAEGDTDVAAVNNAYISITPLHFDLTNYHLINKLQGIEWEK